jgi:chromosome segregation ATPase
MTHPDLDIDELERLASADAWLRKDVYLALIAAIRERDAEIASIKDLNTALLEADVKRTAELAQRDAEIARLRGDMAKSHSTVTKVTEQRDMWRDQHAILVDEITVVAAKLDRIRPVYEAACAWRDADSDLGNKDPGFRDAEQDLADAVDVARKGTP